MVIIKSEHQDNSKYLASNLMAKNHHQVNFAHCLFTILPFTVCTLISFSLSVPWSLLVFLSFGLFYSSHKIIQGTSPPMSRNTLNKAACSLYQKTVYTWNHAKYSKLKRDGSKADRKYSVHNAYHLLESYINLKFKKIMYCLYSPDLITCVMLSIIMRQNPTLCHIQIIPDTS